MHGQVSSCVTSSTKWRRSVLLREFP